MVGTYSQAFPLAPKNARDKAKERERATSKTIDSPKILPTSGIKVVNAVAFSLNQERDAQPRGGDTNITDSSAPADDADVQPGDLLNGVGSASSHESAPSEVFSTTAANSAPANSGMPSNSQTPLTINESSPTDPLQSPRQPKTDTPLPARNGLVENPSNITSLSSSHASTSHAAPLRNLPPTNTPTRLPIFPHGKPRGIRCTHDPELLLHQFRITKEEAKKQKPVIEEFDGAVCTQYISSLGERHLSELVCG